MFKILYFSGYKWGNMGRRKVRLAYEFACQPEVASLLYVEPPVATSVLDLARGHFEPRHLARNRRAVPANYYSLWSRNKMRPFVTALLYDPKVAFRAYLRRNRVEVLLDSHFFPVRK